MLERLGPLFVWFIFVSFLPGVSYFVFNDTLNSLSINTNLRLGAHLGEAGWGRGAKSKSQIDYRRNDDELERRIRTF